jgi:hypothetical protein
MAEKRWSKSRSGGWLRHRDGRRCGWCCQKGSWCGGDDGDRSLEEDACDESPGQADSQKGTCEESNRLEGCQKPVTKTASKKATAMRPAKAVSVKKWRATKETVKNAARLPK